MNKTRLEAFSDGVLAIIITIMILEIKVPHGSEWSSLIPLLPVFISYILSFIFIGIYWGNHHHLLHSIIQISPGIIWANMNLLFWLSLVPFATAWMGENHFAANVVALYGGLLFLCGIAYTILQKVSEKHLRQSEQLKSAFATMKRKGIASAIGYLSSIPLAYIHPLISGIIFVSISMLWVIPDKGVAKALQEES